MGCNHSNPNTQKNIKAEDKLAQQKDLLRKPSREDLKKKEKELAHLSNLLHSDALKEGSIHQPQNDLAKETMNEVITPAN